MVKGILLLIIIMVGGLWIIIRPGLFIIPPMERVPEGTVFFYYDRPRSLPFFSSTDSYCLQTTGAVTESCRIATVAGLGSISQRTLFTLPFSDWLLERSLASVPR